jgi:hypothetical protein
MNFCSATAPLNSVSAREQAMAKVSQDQYMREAYPMLHTLPSGLKVLEDVDDLEMQAHNKSTGVDVQRASESISRVTMPNIRLMTKQNKVKPPGESTLLVSLSSSIILNDRDLLSGLLSEVARLWEAVESYLLMLSTCSTAGRPAGLLEAEIASERG